jgi:hypothetical protein
MIGWLGLFTLHPANLIWLANPALLIAWGLIAVSLRAGRPSSTRARSLGVAAIWTTGFALLVAACFLLPVTVMGMGHTGSGMYPDAIDSRGAGYWFWLASMASAFASAIHLPVPAVPARERTDASG